MSPMNPVSIMLIAGEASGDLLGAELVRALRAAPELGAKQFAPRYFGAGGPRMAEAGVDLEFDLTRHAATGVSDVLRQYAELRRLFDRLLDLAFERQPEAIVCIDYGGFNLRFAKAVRRRLKTNRPEFANWRPRIVQYVSPQVWASRPGRAYAMARDLDLLLCLFPFEPAWYAKRVPKLQVAWVGHPLMDRHQSHPDGAARRGGTRSQTEVALLPGSRPAELKRHLPVMLEASERIHAVQPAHFQIVLPTEDLKVLARTIVGESNRSLSPPSTGRGDSKSKRTAATGVSPEWGFQVGKLTEALGRASLAIASTGTVTLECAVAGVPTVALYKTSWLTAQVAKRLATVEYISMPNILAGEEVFPEFLQDEATPENLSGAALDLLANAARRRAIQTKLSGLVATLGGPGASARAAARIAKLLA